MRNDYARVTIGNDVIIGAESVFAKSVPNRTIIGGNPAKIIRNIDEFENKMQSFNLNSKSLNSKDKKVFLLKMEPDKFIKKIIILITHNIECLKYYHIYFLL